MKDFPLDTTSDAHDKSLMLRIAREDEVALRELIEKHQGTVYGTIAKMLGDPIEAQDLAQRVFVRIYRAAPTYRATAQFKTWMFTIVRNLVFNEHRRRSRATLVSLHPTDPETGGQGTGLELPDSGTKTPSERVLQDEMLQAVNTAILALPEQQRLAMILRRYDEFSYEQETLRIALQDYLDSES
jgi:RNA polymerase sigma-70 factor (ECF subfamily)